MLAGVRAGDASAPSGRRRRTPSGPQPGGPLSPSQSLVRRGRTFGAVSHLGHPSAASQSNSTNQTSAPNGDFTPARRRRRRRRRVVDARPLSENTDSRPRPGLLVRGGSSVYRSTLCATDSTWSPLDRIVLAVRAAAPFISDTRAAQPRGPSRPFTQTIDKSHKRTCLSSKRNECISRVTHRATHLPPAA